MTGTGRRIAVAALAGALIAWPAVGRAAISDAWITTKAKIALLTAKNVRSSGINVDTVDGVVTLHGKVASAEDKANAEAEAKKIDGVREVRNMLQVVPERRKGAAQASDGQLKNRVSKALRNNADLEDSSISVQSVNDGVVLEIVPKAQKRAVKARDDDLTDRVAIRLKEREDLKGASISSDVKNGVARLTGTVDSESQRLEAAIAARSVPGVRAVHDELKVRTASAR